MVVVCVDHANDVWKELQRRQHGGAAVSESSGMLDEMEGTGAAGGEMVAIEVDG